jgi:hypothetical protein
MPCGYQLLNRMRQPLRFQQAWAKGVYSISFHSTFHVGSVHKPQEEPVNILAAVWSPLSCH